MANILSHPTRTLTNAGATVMKRYGEDELVDLSPSYVDLPNYRELMDQARSSDSHSYAIRIHRDCIVKPGQRSVFLPTQIFDSVEAKVLNLDDYAIAVRAAPGSGKSRLSSDALQIGLRSIDTDAVLSAMLSKPFGFPKMTRKQKLALYEDQAMMFTALALSKKTPVGNALFLTDMRDGTTLRAWHMFAKSYTVKPLVTFLVVTPPDVLHSRFHARLEEEAAANSDKSFKESHSRLLETFQRWHEDTIRAAHESLEFDFIIEVPDMGADTLYLSDVFNVVRLSSEKRDV